MEAGKKSRVCFDTTIPNYLFADDSPDRMEWTRRLWEKCRAGDYEICLSDIFFKELEPCPEPKLT
jgi:predicted nucleic acid-binding protein